MKHRILVIVNNTENLKLAADLISKNEISIVTDVEAAIEQLYKMQFDALLYSDSLEATEEKKLLKILSLQEEPPVTHKKDAWVSLETSLQDLIKSIPSHINFIDDGFKNAGLNICLN